MTLSISSVDDVDSMPPRFVLTVASTVVGPMAVPESSTIAVYRVHEDGTRYRVLLETNAKVIGGAYTGFDYHAPYGVLVSYVVVAAGHESAASTPLILDSVDFAGMWKSWVVHSTAPELSCSPAYVASLGDVARPWDGELHKVAQSKFPVPRALGPRSAGTSSVVLYIEPADIIFWDELVADSGTVLINLPPRDGWDVSWLWVQPLDVARGATSTRHGGVYRTITIPYAIVEQPDVDLTPLWTDDDLGAAYATDTLVGAAYLTDTGRGLNLVGS